MDNKKFSDVFHEYGADALREARKVKLDNIIQF